MMNKKDLSFREKIHEIIFEADTPEGKAFDVVLLVFIGLSVIVVMLETVEFFNQRFERLFYFLEWSFTVAFTIEYCLRIYSIQKPWKYIASFYGIVDLLAILPSYLSLFLPGTHYLITIRALRLLRIFRILKLANYLTESAMLAQALRASKRKVTVFLVTVMMVVLIIGSMMYLIESGQDSGFTSIPKSVYWAIVTVTTVGYGDIAPVTPLGQFLSAVLMILGYGVLAVPTGIVSAELVHAQSDVSNKLNTISCPVCSKEGHDSDALFCKFCGGKL
ncbi:MAG: ion transporter [Bacteroidetes bacterium]|nr:ion transporter [Bacteroidota bacterium]MCB0842660.1 ion transporter [Bacteroidota bacterium]